MITRFWLGRRRDGLSRPAFSAHWHGVHGAFGLALPGLRAYVQNHRLPITAGTTPPSFDGCSELDFDDIAAMQAAFRSPAAEAADRDEWCFADPDRFGVVVSTRQVLLGEDVADTPARLLCFVRGVPGRPRAALHDAVLATAVADGSGAGAVRVEVLTAIDDAPEPQAADLVVSLWFPSVPVLSAGVSGWAAATSDALAGLACGRETALVHPRRLR